MLVFYIFGLRVKYSVIWFSIYLVIWIRSNGPARLDCDVIKLKFEFSFYNASCEFTLHLW